MLIDINVDNNNSSSSINNSNNDLPSLVLSCPIMWKMQPYCILANTSSNLRDTVALRIPRLCNKLIDFITALYVFHIE